jgi:hypothetical protein
MELCKVEEKSYRIENYRIKDIIEKNWKNIKGVKVEKA